MQKLCLPNIMATMAHQFGTVANFPAWIRIFSHRGAQPTVQCYAGHRVEIMIICYQAYRCFPGYVWCIKIPKVELVKIQWLMYCEWRVFGVLDNRLGSCKTMKRELIKHTYKTFFILSRYYAYCINDWYICIHHLYALLYSIYENVLTRWMIALLILNI